MSKATHWKLDYGNESQQKSSIQIRFTLSCSRFRFNLTFRCFTIVARTIPIFLEVLLCARQKQNGGQSNQSIWTPYAQSWNKITATPPYIYMKSKTQHATRANLGCVYCFHCDTETPRFSISIPIKSTKPKEVRAAGCWYRNWVDKWTALSGQWASE